jgi:RNA polymerase sigma-70 factor (ECF subfamily)
MQAQTFGILPRSSIGAKPVNMKTETEHQQLARWLADVATSRSKAAFTELFTYFAPKIRQFAISKFGNETLAHEIVQETMTNVWRKAHLYHQDKGAPTTWVFTVMRNAAFDLLRKINNSKEDNLSDDFWPLMEADDDPVADLAEDKNKALISEHLQDLPEAQKEVIQGFYFQELTHEQLAEQLNIPLGTVKSRLRLALGKLRQTIGDNHD